MSDVVIDLSKALSRQNAAKLELASARADLRAAEERVAVARDAHDAASREADRALAMFSEFAEEACS